jgi:hypothetical protein
MLNFDDVGKPIAMVGKHVLSISDKPVEGGCVEFKCRGDQSIQQIPDKNTERSILYITAPSGSGKSHYTREYIAAYHKQWPKRDVFVLSSLPDDPTLDKLKYIKRLKIKEDTFLSADLSAAEFKDSLCVFDDVDCLTQKPVKAKVNALLWSLLETGRHFNCSVIYTSHLACAGNDTKRVLNECNSITVFLKNSGGRTSRYLLSEYLGLDKAMIARLKKVNSRAITVLKTYPQVVLAEKEAFVLNP